METLEERIRKALEPERHEVAAMEAWGHFISLLQSLAGPNGEAFVEWAADSINGSPVGAGMWGISFSVRAVNYVVRGDWTYGAPEEGTWKPAEPCSLADRIMAEALIEAGYMPRGMMVGDDICPLCHRLVPGNQLAFTRPGHDGEDEEIVDLWLSDEGAQGKDWCVCWKD